MTNLNQFPNVFAFQKEALEPLRAFNGVAVEAFERLSQQNYAVLGDYINFAVDQARLPTNVANYGEFLARQIESTRAFGEQLARRTQEYVEIAGSVQAKAQDTVAASQNKAA
jgi:hypothetical protein